MQSTKDMIIDATIDIVAAKGLEGFSINQIGKKIGIAQGTIYCHFVNKEDLLYECFLMVNREIAALFQNSVLPKDMNEEQIMKFLHEQWIRYFAFMIDNGKKSLFYYAYRESENLERVLMKNNQMIAKEMEKFTQVIGGAFSQTGIFNELPADYLWVYVLDGTGNFVKHILRNHIAREAVDVEKIWKLLFGGISGNI